MNGAVTLLPVRVVRSIVVEQLNADQWHAFTEGTSEAWTSIAGAEPQIVALGLAFEWRELTGLPVVIQPLTCRNRVGGAV